MYIGNGQKDPLTIDNEEVEEVKEFKYLGSIKTNTGDCSKDINTRIAMAKKRMVELNNIWKDKSINVQLKLKIMKCLVWTIMTYGAEGWTIKRKDEQRIDATEMWFYRRMLRISWKDKRTNKSILEELNTNRTLLEKIKTRKLNFFGHASRNKKCRLVKDVIQGKMEGKRGRGRPRGNYISNIQEWSGMTGRSIFVAVEDRTEWRRTARRAARSASNYVDAVQ